MRDLQEESRSARQPDDFYFMGLALEQARLAARAGEVPVGAVVVQAGRVVGWGRNRREQDKNALAHAELEAISGACRALGGWRLWQCTLYVTLEPCPMCAGAAVNSRLPRVVFGASDPRFGCCGSLIDLTALPFNHRPLLVGGVRGEECAALLSDFFRSLRQRRAARPGSGRPPLVPGPGKGLQQNRIPFPQREKSVGGEAPKEDGDADLDP